MKRKSDIKMGTMPDIWMDGKAKTITFSVTEDCNLACKYCYMTGKNHKNRMNFETAKKVVDYVLAEREMFDSEGGIWEFVGGEPFIEIDLIDRITDYIKLRMYQLDHPWFKCYRFNFSTNGLLYGTEKVQNYIKKNRGHISIGISVDGNKIKHDLQRIKVDGSGSYDDILKHVPLWLEQFPGASTKATFAHDDLVYLKDSIISLWDNGIRMVAANVVFEDVWHEGDDILFESQLRELADYVLDNRLWKDYSVRFFDPSIGFPLDDEAKEQNYCGAGKMMAVDYQGHFFPCVRFLDFSLNNRPGVSFGDVDSGASADRMRPFYALSLRSQSSEECVNCEVASGCAWCTGFNYDVAETDTVFQRAIFNCKMHKANVRACEYFWEQFKKRTGLPSPRDEYKKDLYFNHPQRDKYAPKYLQFITSDAITPHCSYRSTGEAGNVMGKELMEKGLAFADENGYIPVFLGDAEEYKEAGVSIVDSREKTAWEDAILVCDNNADIPAGYNGNSVLLISRENISQIGALAQKLFAAVSRVNLVFDDIKDWSKEDLEKYREQLDVLKEMVLASYKSNSPLELNVLTDILNLSGRLDCDAGQNTFSLAPNGKFYICPAFYFNNPEDSIGDLEKGIHVKNAYLMDVKNAEICSGCDANHCMRCKFLNKKLTGEINTPSGIQCVISHIERNKARELQQELVALNLLESDELLPEIDYLDPFEKILLKIKGVNCNV